MCTKFNDSLILRAIEMMFDTISGIFRQNNEKLHRRNTYIYVYEVGTINRNILILKTNLDINDFILNLLK